MCFLAISHVSLLPKLFQRLCKSSFHEVTLSQSTYITEGSQRRWLVRIFFFIEEWSFFLADFFWSIQPWPQRDCLWWAGWILMQGQPTSGGHSRGSHPSPRNEPISCFICPWVLGKPTSFIAPHSPPRGPNNRLDFFSQKKIKKKQFYGATRATKASCLSLFCFLPAKVQQRCL